MYLAKIETIWQNGKPTSHGELVGNDKVTLCAAAKAKLEEIDFGDNLKTSSWIVGHHVREAKGQLLKQNSSHYHCTLITDVGTYFGTWHIEIKEVTLITVSTLAPMV